MWRMGIAVLLSLIQISPIKLNPWDGILGWLGKKLNGSTEKRLEELQKQVRDMWINTHRQSILTFARECRADMHHDAEEWNHILSIADEYEVYCAKNTVSNGGKSGYRICPGLVSGIESGTQDLNRIRQKLTIAENDEGKHGRPCFYFAAGR